jgi:hypothetical protein
VHLKEVLLLEGKPQNERNQQHDHSNFYGSSHGVGCPAFPANSFIIPPYLVEYPLATGAFGLVSFFFNCLKFNGYDCLSLPISEPTESARTFHGVSALPTVKADPKPDHQIPH